MMASPSALVHRSFLYAPGSNAKILGKALTAGSDAVILDLEDAVPEPAKADARERVAEIVRTEAARAAPSVHVRVNQHDGRYCQSDIVAVVYPGLEAIRLPKCESAVAVAEADALLTELERERGVPAGSVLLYPTIESAAGLLAVRDIARSSPRVAALAFGPSDFAGDLGLPEIEDVEATIVARTTLVVESRAARIGPPVDGAFGDLRDLEGLRQVATFVRRLGFAGKSAIHPAQLPVLHEVFTPSPQQLQRARRIVASLNHDSATAVVDGEFVDRAVVNYAKRLLEMSERSEERGSHG